MKKLYTVYQHVTPDGLYYFGQTNDIKRRWDGNGAKYKTTALQPYIEKYGWDNIQHIVLFRDQTKENALWIEDFLIETAREDGVCINKKRSGNISKEEGYFQQHYEQNKDKKQQYYKQNKRQIREYRKQYREQNKDYNKQYYEQNKEQILEQSRQYYQKNREKKLEYQREYRKRKKLEKQLKEVQTTLF